MEAFTIFLMRLRMVLSGPRGAATAEYALLLALVVIILIGTLAQLGQVLNSKLSAIISDINTAQ